MKHFVLAALVTGSLLTQHHDRSAIYDRSAVYSSDDTHQAIDQAAAAHNLPAGYLDCIVFRESTYNPYAVGRLGERGAVQILPGGVRERDFYARGYDSVWNPYAAVDYLARAILEGLGPQWTGYRACTA